MSSIKLSPSASGTGEFTIAAPNSNTNRTLNLPDTSGTVVALNSWSFVESGTTLFIAFNGTNVGKIDSSGNLTVIGNVIAFGTM